MQILKNSAKFSVFKKKIGNKFSIIKIANKSAKKIFDEINLIDTLKKNSKFYKTKIPQIVSKGIISKGFYKGKGYYEQTFIPGKTLSEILQNKYTKKNYLNRIKKNILIELIFSVKTSSNKKKAKQNQSIKNLIFMELKKIKEKKFYDNLFNIKKLNINNKSLNNIHFYIKKLNSFKKIRKLYSQNNYVSNVGHWNYHGGNIIFPKKNKTDFKLIDPDAKWKFNDPFFSLARYFYTYVHDTMEFNSYLISTKEFKKKINKFSIKLLWKKQIIKNYKTIFSNIFCSYFNDSQLKSNLSTNDFLRLNLNLCLCLLRGVNANHQNEIKYISKKSEKFKNKGIFLFLITNVFLKNFTNFLQKND